MKYAVINKRYNAALCHILCKNRNMSIFAAQPVINTACKANPVYLQQKKHFRFWANALVYNKVVAINYFIKHKSEYVLYLGGFVSLD